MAVNRLSCDFQGSNGLISRDRWKCLEELFERVASFEIVEQALDRHARTDENGCSTHDLGVRVDHLVTVEHARHFTPVIADLFRRVGVSPLTYGANAVVPLPRSASITLGRLDRRSWSATAHRRDSEMKFKIVGEFRAVETIANGRQIRVLAMLRKRWGSGRWRKMKGIVLVQLRSGRIREAEVHWYEAHGIGRRDFKIKKLLK